MRDLKIIVFCTFLVAVYFKESSSTKLSGKVNTNDIHPAKSLFYITYYGKFECGAVLIRPKLVLVLAKCVECISMRYYNETKVVDFDRTIERDIEIILEQERQGSHFLKTNLAIITLASTINVQYLELPTSEMLINPAPDNVTLIRWNQWDTLQPVVDEHIMINFDDVNNAFVSTEPVLDVEYGGNNNLGGFLVHDQNVIGVAYGTEIKPSETNFVYISVFRYRDFTDPIVDEEDCNSNNPLVAPRAQIMYPPVI